VGKHSKQEDPQALADSFDAQFTASVERAEEKREQGVDPYDLDAALDRAGQEPAT
jgi:hypothetical protein